MKIKYDKLKNAVNVLGNVTLNYSLEAPLQSLIEFSTQDGFLYGYAWDITNYIRIKIQPATEDFNAVVDYNMFNNIVKSIKSDEVELIIDSKNKKIINIKSDNVKCKLSNIHDSSNNEVHIPKFTPVKNYYDIDLSKISNYSSLIKSTIDNNFVEECYRNVFISKSLLFTDLDNVLYINEDLFNNNILLTTKSISIAAKLNGQYAIENGNLYIKTDDIDFLAVGQDSENFVKDELLGLFKKDFDNSCVINGENIINAINTSKLFNYTNILLDFTTSGVYVKIKNIDFEYKISDYSCTNEVSYIVSIDVLKRLVISKNDIKISYDNANSKIIRADYENIHGIFCIGDD